MTKVWKTREYDREAAFKLSGELGVPQAIAAMLVGRGYGDRAAAELAIDADLIAPRAALERIAAEGDDGVDVLLPWQQQLLRVDD